MGDLEDRAIGAATATIGSSKEVAVGVEDQAGFGISSIDPIEVGNGGDRGGAAGDLEDRAKVVCSTAVSRSEQVAVGVEGYAAMRIDASGLVGLECGNMSNK